MAPNAPHPNAALGVVFRANGTDSEAQYLLGCMFYSGRGVRRSDFGCAVRWFLRAAQTGHIAARVNLGIMQYYGLGVSRGVDRGSNLFSNALIRYKRTLRPPYVDNEYFSTAVHENCAKGHYFVGLTLESYNEPEAAMTWFAKAACSGHAPSQFIMGIILYHGLSGADCNKGAALQWFALASRQGHGAARTCSRILERRDANNNLLEEVPPNIV